MELLLSVPAFVWLLMSAIFFACGEFLSKTWANSPTLIEVIALMIAYTISSLLWLPALLHRNQLAVTGTIWLLLSILIVVGLGIFVFHEKVTYIQGVGIFLALVAAVLLNI